MPVDRKEFIVLWPEYFDLNCTKSEGRMVPNRLAVEAPTIELIASAIKSMGLEMRIEADKSYPKFWWKKKGRILVKKTMTKNVLIRKIAEQMQTKIK